MDKSILTLLFDYKGTISYREFRAGTILLFILTAYSLFSLMHTSFIQILLGRYGADWLAYSVIYQQIISSYIPVLVPVGFIISYSSFVIGLKRMRVFTSHKPSAVYSGIVNFLFYASFIALLRFVLYNSSLKVEPDYTSMVTPLIILFMLIFYFVGLINIFLLYRRRRDEIPFFSQVRDRLSILNYIMKLGKLMLISVSIALVIAVLSLFLFPLYSLFDSLSIFYIIFGIGISVFYFRYTFLRMKDAGVSLLWLIGILVVYLIVSTLMLWTGYNQYTSFFYISTLFSIVTSFVLGAQFLLFLLPSKKSLNYNTSQDELH